jgi:pyruvate dehydrogenase E2 component (dihydrolipoamide acetyltransferase)
MPQLSDTMTEGTLVKWNKREGDPVKAGEEIAEIETDKATMPMETGEAGTLAILLVQPGGKVPVGAAVGVVALKNENPAEIKAKYASGTASTPGATPAAAVAAAPVAAGVVAVGSISQPAPADNSSDRIRISPLARRIADDAKLDVTSLQGSGPGGRIVQKDVLAVLESPAAPKPASTPAPAAKPTAAPVLPTRLDAGAVEKIPLTKMRQTIATRLQQAKQAIPHVYLVIDVDLENLVALRERVNKSLEAEKIRVSIADFISKAVAMALRANPAMNAHFDEKNNQIIRHGDVHLGNAVALPDGLIVPVLRNIDQMGLKEIRLRSQDLYDRARTQRLKREELSGGTFTISNLGMWGIKEFNAIINPPEIGILAVAAAEKRAVVVNGQIVARTMMTLTLSADHRAIDGAGAADFLKSLKSYLEDPAMMLV